jgi:hypothetical protein
MEGFKFFEKRKNPLCLVSGINLQHIVLLAEIIKTGDGNLKLFNYKIISNLKFPGFRVSIK